MAIAAFAYAVSVVHAERRCNVAAYRWLAKRTGRTLAHMPAFPDTLMQPVGSVVVRTAPMQPSGFRTDTNTKRQSTLAANTVRVKTSFMSAPNQWDSIALIIRGRSGHELCSGCRCFVICCCRRDRLHRCERVTWIAVPGLHDISVWSGVPLKLGIGGYRHPWMCGVEHDPFRPFVVRTDAQANPLGGSRGRMQMRRGIWKPPIAQKQRKEQGTSDPSKVLTYRHGKNSFSGVPWRS